jgi:hypothetical protein
MIRLLSLLVLIPFPGNKKNVTAGRIALEGRITIKTVRVARKPNSVPGLGYPFRATIIHLWMPVARHLLRPTRELGRATLKRSSIWSCTGWGLPSFPGHPGNWCALTAPFHPYPTPIGAGRFAFCCTFLRVTATPCYGAPCPVVFGLSSGKKAQRSSGLL